MKYICPVCAYDQLNSPPQDYTICPCCGTEFGYHDFTLSYTELRERWLSSGAIWHSRRILPPVGWTAQKQLARAGLLPRPMIFVAGTPVHIQSQNPDADLYSRHYVNASTISQTGTYREMITTR